MKIVIKDGKPVIQEMPDGNEVLFFAKIDERHGYCVVFGPAEKCLPTEGSTFAELDSAKVAFGLLGVEMEIVRVTHGHKYSAGGGFVDTEDSGDIAFRPVGDEDDSTHEREKIVEVYVAK